MLTSSLPMKMVAIRARGRPRSSRSWAMREWPSASMRRSWTCEIENRADSDPAKKAEQASSRITSPSRSRMAVSIVMSRSSWPLDGQRHQEPCPLSAGPLDPHAATMRLDEAAGDGQAQPHAAVRPGGGAVDLEEGVEDAQMVLATDADAGVLDHQL